MVARNAQLDRLGICSFSSVYEKGASVSTLKSSTSYRKASSNVPCVLDRLRESYFESVPVSKVSRRN